MTSATRFKSTIAAAVAVVVLAVTACGGDSKAPEAPVQQAPGVPSGGPLARPGSSGEAVLDVWRLLKAGAIPPLLLSYEPRVLRTVGPSTMAGALQSASAEVSSLAPRITSVDETPSGTVVTVRAVGPSAAGSTYGYVMVKRRRRWLVVYDTLVERLLRAFVVEQTMANLNPKGKTTNTPTNGAKAAGSAAVRDFAVSVLPKRRGTKPATKRPAAAANPAATTP